MWYQRLLLCSATKETQLWFWVEHLTPWGWRLLYQPAGGQVFEPTPPISWVLPSGVWTRSVYVLHIFCSWDVNQDPSNLFVVVLPGLPKDPWKAWFAWKTVCKCAMEAQNSGWSPWYGQVREMSLWGNLWKEGSLAVKNVNGVLRGL